MRIFLLLVFCILLTSFPSYGKKVETENLWLRETIPGQPNGAGFGILKNSTDMDMFLIGATTSAAADVELHQHVIEGNQMRMEQIEAILVPAHAQVELKPGGYHLMLMGLKTPLVADVHYDLSLVFSDGTIIELNVPVKALLQGYNNN